MEIAIVKLPVHKESYPYRMDVTLIVPVKANAVCSKNTLTNDFIARSDREKNGLFKESWLIIHAAHNTLFDYFSLAARRDSLGMFTTLEWISLSMVGETREKVFLATDVTIQVAHWLY